MMNWHKSTWFWIVLVVVSDRVTKFWAMNYGWWQLNQGGVFGVLPGGWWPLVVAGLLIFLFTEFFKSRKESRLVLGVVMAAGFCNLADRIVFGGVVDFIVYPIFGVVGNLADVWLSLGVIILLINQIPNIKSQITN